MSKRLYVAYGSNLNIAQMKYRCPTAKFYGVGKTQDYELQFKGYPRSAFATIAPKDGASVPVAVWEIQPQDERSLDTYEGYPTHYFKQDAPVQLDGGKEISAMVYIMNLKMQFGMPSEHYYQTVYDGYKDCNLDTDFLKDALQSSALSFYSSAVGAQNKQRTMFEDEDEEYDEDYDEDEDCEEDEDLDESDPFYINDGMSM